MTSKGHAWCGFLCRHKGETATQQVRGANTPRKQRDVAVELNVRFDDHCASQQPTQPSLFMLRAR